MPRKRRPVRPVRRPTFRPAPEPASEEEAEDAADSEAAPSFADEPAVAVPGLGLGGPVDTRPQRAARNERVQGRRLAQLRRSSGEERGPVRAGSPTGMLPALATGDIQRELRQILVTTVAMVVLIVVLAALVR